MCFLNENCNFVKNVDNIAKTVPNMLGHPLWNLTPWEFYMTAALVLAMGLINPFDMMAQLFFSTITLLYTQHTSRGLNSTWDTMDAFKKVVQITQGSKKVMKLLYFFYL